MKEAEGGSGLKSASSVKSVRNCVFTFRVLLEVGVVRKRRFVGVLIAVPYSMSSSVCLLFFMCCADVVKTELIFLTNTDRHESTTCLPSEASLFLFPLDAAPTAEPRTAGTSGRSRGTPGPLPSPKHLFGLLVSFQASNTNSSRIL